MNKMNAKVIPLLSICLLLQQWLYAQKNFSIEQLPETKKNEWGLSDQDLYDVILKDHYPSLHNGLQHYYYTQRHQGIEVYNAILGIHVDPEGNLAYATSRFIPQLTEKINAATPLLPAEQAILSAAVHLEVDLKYELHSQATSEGKKTIFLAPGLSKSPVEVRLVYQPIPNVVRLAWEILIEPLGKNDRWNIRIDALNGDILQQDNWILHCHFPAKKNFHDAPLPLVAPAEPVTKPPSAKTMVDEAQYHVFPLPVESPIHGSRAIVANPADPLASPFGWHDTDGQAGPEYQITRGNNAHAFQDRQEKDRSQDDEPDGGESLIFDFPFDDQDSLIKNLPAATTQLFYTTNMVHDFAYHYGFDEAAGNFQATNYSGAGKDDDAVIAHAQNGAEINSAFLRNNANFAITPDGQSPVMQMYIWERTGGNYLLVEEPSALAGLYQSGTAEFGPSLTDAPLRGELALAFDDSDNPGKVCNEVINVEEVKGRIAMLDRGDCFFQQKTLNVQKAGAIACVICNYEDVSLQMARSSNLPNPEIPSVILAYNDCQRIRRLLAEGVQVTLQLPKDGAPDILDADFDNGIIVHEYVHGISTRLTGGPSTAGCLNNDENLGEGWSDFFALVLTQPPQLNGSIARGIGNYVIPLDINGRGIRRFPYSTDKNINNQTYDDIIATSAVHEVGEVWAGVLWDLYWAFIDSYGYDQDLFTGNGGNNLALQIIMDGMKLQSCNPGFIDARDAILEADRINNNGANQCLIWEVFARRGLGFSARQNSPRNENDGRQAFDVLPTCIKELKIAKNVTPNVLPGEAFQVELTVTNHKPEAVEDLLISDLLGNGLRLANGEISGVDDYELVGNELQFRISALQPGAKRQIRYSLTTDPGNLSYRLFLDDVEDRNNLQWAARTLTGNTPWKPNDELANSGERSWHIPGATSSNDQVLELIDPVFVEGDQPVLRFFHSYEIEAGRDGGLVQISRDGGQRWENIPEELFFRNGYRGRLAPGTLTQPGLRAFWGATEGFISSYIDLSDYRDEELLIRFRYGSDQETNRNASTTAGWRIDDIELLDMYNYYTQACISSAQGDRACALPPGRGTIVETTATTTDIATLETASGHMRLFPNPARERVAIALDDLPAGEAQLSVRTVDGRLVSQQIVDIQGPKTTVPLAVEQWSRGVYLVRLQTEAGALTTKLVIQ